MTKSNKKRSGVARGSLGELTDEQIAAEDEFMRGVPRFNIGAFLLPGIWGPAHGIWISILFYPIWLFTDNVLYAAYSEHTPLSIVLAVVMFCALFAVQVLFGILSQPYAWHRADSLGVSKEKYLRREKIWTIAMVVLGVVAIVVATYYNIDIRPTVVVS